jgi:soluble lytic murein transglycosylase-like protein
MATLTLSAPMTKPMTLVSPTTWYKTREGLRTQMIKRWKDWGGYIKKFAKTSNIPEEVIFAFMMVESGGNPEAGGTSSATQGLMQFNKNYVSGSANSTLAKEYKEGRLSQVEKDVLKKYGFTFGTTGIPKAFTQADLIKPELNLLVGTIILGQFIDSSWGTDPDGTIRMDRIIARYNWGPAGFERNKLGTAPFNTVYNNIPAVTKVYIQKILGKNGALDIAINDKSYFPEVKEA